MQPIKLNYLSTQSAAHGRRAVSIGSVREHVCVNTGGGDNVKGRVYVGFFLFFVFFYILFVDL